MTPPILRPYTPADENGAIALWHYTWAQHYPHIDFNARIAWWRERWCNELVPVAQIVLAEINDTIKSCAGSPLSQGRAGNSTGRKRTLLGFVTIDPVTMYLDQIVVAPERWGSGIAAVLLDEAKRLSPKGIDLLVNKDNFRAIRFYEKHGFVYDGEDKNPVSGNPVNKMKWRVNSIAP